MHNNNTLRRLLKPLLSAGFAFSYTLSLCAGAQSLTLSNAPLQAQGSTQPNLMILLDSSSSMGTLSPRIDGKLRIEIARAAASSLLDSIPDSSMRVGYATYDSDVGAKVRNNIAELTPGQRTAIKGQITATQADGWTPLSESVMDIGRYFTYGYTGNLTLHPDNSFDQTADNTKGVGNIFSREPGFTNNQSAPSEVIEYYCQKNFLMLLTDGEPTQDRAISDSLKDYAFTCPAGDPNCKFKKPAGDGYGTEYPNNGSAYLRDVAAALYDMDLRPDLDDDDGDEVKNNVTSYFVGFAAESLRNNQLLEDAGRLGGGGYIFAEDSDELTEAFNKAIGSISNSIGSQSSVSFNSTSLDIGSVIYSAQFDTTDFSGRLFARAMNPQTGRIADDLWDAGEELATRSGGRQIITSLDGEGVSFTVSDLDVASEDDIYTITVRARGVVGDERIRLNVGGTTVGSWKLSKNYREFTATTSNTSGKIQVEFYNDLGSRDVQVDYIQIDGSTLQAEGQSENTGVWGNNSCGGGTNSEWLHCNGYIEFCSIAGCELENVTPQRADLRVNANTGLIDGLWEERLNYIRGDTSKDGVDGFRRRGTFKSGKASGKTKLLGDIVHSTPIYVGKPELNWPETLANKSYAQFQIDNEERTPIVYVGANDGMLHGLRASDGEEVFAYVPSLVLSSERNEGLHAFTSSNYEHRYYVDQTPAVSDVFIKPKGGNFAEWRTVLVSGLRGGGKGYFALDITNPDGAGSDKLTAAEANAEKIVLWEFDGGNDTDRANLGYGFSEVQIAKLNNGRWAAIFGNGYNSESGKAGLFIVYIEEGTDGEWNSGDWEFITTNEGTPTGRKNGLSSPRLIDLNGDRVVDRVYAGDLMGNMWSFDLCNADNNGDCQANGWDVDYKLFSVGNGEPHNAITAAPLVARNTVVGDGTAPNVLVLFGTGQYLNTDDLTEKNAGAFYVAWDKGSGGLGVGDLVERDLQSAGGKRKISDATDDTINWAEKSGWYMSLDGPSGAYSAERVVSAATLRRNTVFFSTIIPNPQPCASSGTGWLMSLDFRTGMPEEGLERPVTDFNNDGVIDEDDEGYVGKEFEPPPCSGDDCDDDDGPPGMPGQSGFIGDTRCTPGSAGGVLCDDIDVGDEEREGRLSWEEFAPR